jgi:thioesterase domain-containing protein/acyl carrier protein
LQPQPAPASAAILPAADDPLYVGPRNALEGELCWLWAELLGRDKVGIADDFFALGGHSLLAVMLVNRIKRDYDVDISVSRLLEHPTIATFAPNVSAVRALPRVRPAPHLLAMNAEGKRSPLVLIAGIGGHTFTYREFPRLLGPEQPVLTFSAIGAEGEVPPATQDIEAMAEIYEQELTLAVPKGPLVVGGFSFGALPAFELARRLRRSGREVPLIVSFDGFAPQYPRVLPLPQRMAAHALEFLSATGAERDRYLRERVARLKERVWTLLGKEAELAPVTPFADHATNRRMQQLWVQHRSAARRYAPQERLDCDLLLVKAAKPFRWVATEMADPHYGWEQYVAGTISTVTVPGDHQELFSRANQERVAHAVSQHLQAN